MVHLAGVWMPGMWGMSLLSVGTWGVSELREEAHKDSPSWASCPPFIQASPPGKDDITAALQKQKTEVLPRPHRERKRWITSLVTILNWVQAGAPDHHVCSWHCPVTRRQTKRTQAPLGPMGGSGHLCPGDPTEMTAAEWARGWTASKSHGHVSRLPLFISIATETAPKKLNIIQLNW